MLFYLALLGTVAASALLLLAPAWGILVAFVAKTLVDATWDTNVISELALTEIISGVLPLIILARIPFATDASKSLQRMPLKGIWLLWSADIVIFSMAIMYTDGLLTGMSVLFRHLNGLAGFYMVQAYFSQDERLTRRFLLCLLVAGLFPVLTGVYETATGHHWVITYGEEGKIRTAGLYHDAITIRYYSLQTILGLLLLAKLYLNRSTVGKFGVFAYGAAAAFVIYGAYSKAGTLTLLSWLLFWPLLLKNYRALAVVGVIAVIAAGWYGKELMDAGGFIFQKEISAVSGEGDSQRAFNGRIYHWKEMLEQWPKLGLAGKLFGSGHIATGAHNDYIQVLFHGGVVGLMIYVALLLVVLKRIARDLAYRRDAFSVAALLAMIMWIIDSVGLVPSAYSGYQWYIWGVVGLCLRKREDQLQLEAGGSVVPTQIAVSTEPVADSPPLLLPRPATATFLNLPPGRPLQ